MLDDTENEVQSPFCIFTVTHRSYGHTVTSESSILVTESSIFVTESTKTSLIAYRQALRKAGFNYSKCCSSPMAEATSIEFSHIIQQYLTFKSIL